MHFLIACLLTLLALPAGAVERVIHYHNDALGSPIAATDQEGRVVWRKSYAPYGQPIGPAAPNEPGYTGKLEEPDLGIQNFGARWYDPRIGRFLAIDPAGFDPQNPQSFNRYAYANNNPYRFVDPDGNSPLDAGFFIADTVSFGLAAASGNPAAIQSAAFDLAASAVGLASPVPGTGLAIKAARAADKVGDAVGVAKSGERLVIGRGRDLAKEGALEPGEFKFQWPPTGTTKSEWKMNSGLLREEISKSRPIRDASPGDTGGMYLNAERNLLRDRGSSFEADTNLWMPPKQ